MVDLNKKVCAAAAIFCLTVFLHGFAQGVSVPHLESTNLFFGTKGSPYIGATSVTDLKLRFTPSYVCYFDMGLSANVNELVRFFNPVQNTPAYKGELNFWSASINFPHIKNKTVSVSLFTGNFGELGTDSVLQEHLKTKMEEPRFQKYYPGLAFKPQKKIKGSGFTVYGAFQPGIYTGVYTYWNERLHDKLEVKTDFRMGGTFDFFTFDLFAGAAIPPLNIGNSTFRAGTAMLFTAGENYDFFAEMGLAKVSPQNLSPEEFTKSFYALFEARIKKNIFTASISSFLSPVFLLPAGITNTSLKDSSFLGLNALLAFGNLTESKMEGGLSVLLSVNPQKPALITPFSFSIAPFYTVRTGNVELDFRLPINPLLYNDLKSMIVGQFSIKAVY